MESTLYSKFSTKSKKHNALLDSSIREEEVTIVDLAKSETFKNYGLDYLVRAFCNDLNKLLDFENIESMINHIFEIDSSLTEIQSKIDFFTDDEVPNLYDFYNQLSPLLLRLICDAQSIDDINERNEYINESWKEALRVAIEEELYIWKDKFSHKAN